MVQKAEEYGWSSAREHVKGSFDGILSQRCYLWQEISDWKRYLEKEEDSGLIQKIRKCSLTGWPCRDEAFVQELEGRFSRRLPLTSLSLLGFFALKGLSNGSYQTCNPASVEIFKPRTFFFI
jgi:hypothetical protein